MKVKENWSKKASQGTPYLSPWELQHAGADQAGKFPIASQDESSVLGNIWNREASQQRFRTQ